MMSEGVLGRLSGLGYNKARALLLAGGISILLLTALFMYVRRVETIEVVGILLFIPIFVSFVFWGVRGGVAAAVLASTIYILLRLGAIEQVGLDRFIGPILSRVFGYLAFGLIGGVANTSLEASLNKLELYDQIDDHTGLYNARFLVQDTDLELSRSKRYQTIFSVAVVDFPAGPMASLPRRKRVALRRDLGRLMEDAVRTVDRPVHGFDGESHRFAVVLPETGTEGARIFTTRLAENMHRFLTERGVGVTPEQVTPRWMTFPDDGDAAVLALQEEFRRIDRLEHPEASEASTTPAA